MKRLLAGLVLVGCQSTPQIEDPPVAVEEEPAKTKSVVSFAPNYVDAEAKAEEPTPAIEESIEIPEEAERESADRDGDGNEEVLATWYDGGSGFGGTTCVLDDPGRRKRWEASSFSSFGSWAYAVAEPPGLPNDALRDALMDCVTGPVKAPTAGLRWWLAAFEANTTHTASGAISARWEIDSGWQQRASLEEPGTVIRVPVDQVRPWMRGLFEADQPDFGDTALRLVFSGSYGRFRPSAERDRMALHNSPHAVVLKTKNRHALLFMSDGLWGGTDKRRHRSIVASGFINSGEVWALQTSGSAPHTVWILSMKEQIAVTLSDLNWTAEVDFEELPKTFTVKRTSSGFRFEAGGATAALAFPD